MGGHLQGTPKMNGLQAAIDRLVHSTSVIVELTVPSY